MSDKSSAQHQRHASQQIIEQDNAQLQALLDQMDKAQERLNEAGAAWEADQTSEIASDNLSEAIATYQEAADEVAQLLRSLWQAGYRLMRPEA